MKIAITGASGHIASVLSANLIQQGHDVVALVRNDDRALKDFQLTKVKGDVMDPNSLRELMNGCDAVIHAAGAISLGYKFNRKIHDINVIGTKNVLEVAKEQGVKRVVHFSSIHVFKQFPYDVSLDESREFVSNKSIFYDQTKRDGHLLALEAVKNGQDVVIVCPTGVLGPFDHKPSKLGKAIIDIYNGKIPAVVKGGFDFVDVRDVVNGAISALFNGKTGETYILGGKFHSIKEFSNIVLNVKKKERKLPELPISMALIGLPFIKSYAFITRRPPLYDKVYLDILQDGNKQISSDKAMNDLGCVTRSMQETIEDTISWFKESGKIK